MIQYVDSDENPLESHTWVTVEGRSLPYQAYVDLEHGGIILREQDASFRDAFRYDPETMIIRCLRRKREEEWIR